MKQLTLLRHGKAENHGKDVEDFDRRLLRKGIQRITEVAQKAVEKWGSPDLVVSSPAARALATAELFAEELSDAQDIQLFEELYAAETADIADVVRQLPPEADYVVMVGHNPSLEEFAFLLLKEDVSLQTGACIHFALDIERWKDFSITLKARDKQILSPA